LSSGDLKTPWMQIFADRLNMLWNLCRLSIPNLLEAISESNNQCKSLNNKVEDVARGTFDHFDYLENDFSNNLAFSVKESLSGSFDSKVLEYNLLSEESAKMTFISKEDLSLVEQRLASLTAQLDEAVLEAKQMKLKLMTLENSLRVKI